MAKEDPSVHRGNIATYEHASDEFLRRRKEELRAQIRNQSLTIGEYIRDVASHIFVTIVAAGFAVWNAIGRFVVWGMHLKDNTWFREHLVLKKGGVVTNVYVPDQPTFEKMLEGITHDIATFFFPGKASSVDQVCGSMEAFAKHFGFRGGVEEVKKLRADFANMTKLSHIPAKDRSLLDGLRNNYRKLHKKPIGNAQLLEAYKQEKLFLHLSELEKANPNAGYSQIATLWQEMRERVTKAGLPQNSFHLGNQGWLAKRLDVVKRAVTDDNDRIMRKYRLPTTIILVGTAAAVTAYQSYRYALRQKSLDQESEMSHIERLEAERAEARSKAGAVPQRAG